MSSPVLFFDYSDPQGPFSDPSPQVITSQTPFCVWTIYGNGEQIRSFCFVDDLITGIIKLFFKPEIFEPINLGNPSPINMKALATEIIKLTNSKSEIIHLPLPSDDPVTRIPDISRAENELDWMPVIERSEGLQRTIKYFADELKIVI